MKNLLCPLATVALLICGGCSSGGEGSEGTGGGGVSSGGSSASGGAPGSGGASSSGGATASGGSSGTGGSVSTGSGGRSNGGTGGGTASGGSTAGTGGSGSGGRSGTGGSVSGSGGRGGSGGATASGGSTGSGGAVSTSNFSFFVTSIESMRKLSNSQDGFGGDLTFGKADGLTGADEICRQIAEIGMAGAGSKQWRAFLSVAKGPSGTQVNAIDRVGNGPWYDRMGRLVANNKADLVQTRPKGAHTAIIDNLPNENGIPNRPDTSVDNHDTLTGSKADGTLVNATATCLDWTSKVTSTESGKPQVGHSWPSSVSGNSWIQAHMAGGCAPGVNLVQQGGQGTTVGSAGGYGGIYCLALTP